MKEIHFYSSLEYVPETEKDHVLYSYNGTEEKIYDNAKIIHTTQMALLSFWLQSEFDYDIYVHDSACPEGYLISYDERQCNRTDKELREVHNIFKMWVAGAFVHPRTLPLN